MPENNFEKNVQQEMLGFKVKPSEELWAKVEERIRKKKRRRFFFILFFSGLTLLGYWQRDLLFQEKESSKPESVSMTQEKVSADENLKTITSEKINKQDNVIINTEKNRIGLTKNEKQVDPIKEKMISVKKEKQINNASDISVIKSNQVSGKPTFVTSKSVIELTDTFQNPKNSSLVKIDTENKANNNKEISIISSDTSISKEIEKVSETKIQNVNIIQKDSIPITETKTDTTAAPKKQPAVSKKWKWGVQATPGISSLVDKLIIGPSAKSTDFSNVPTGGFPTPPASASKRKSGFALQLSGFAQKKISSKTEFLLGLQYSYYSDRIQIGDFRLLSQSASQPQSLFGATQGYRAANPNISHINRYHFLELPLELSFQLNKNSDKPFYLNLGLTTGRLISTNILVYDTAYVGIYIDGEKQLNKTQFKLSSGILWEISAKKLLWSVGPIINFHFNRFLDNSFESEKYLLMPGIRTKFIFPGKNDARPNVPN